VIMDKGGVSGGYQATIVEWPSEKSGGNKIKQLDKNNIKRRGLRVLGKKIKTIEGGQGDREKKCTARKQGPRGPTTIKKLHREKN